MVLPPLTLEFHYENAHHLNIKFPCWGETKYLKLKTFITSAYRIQLRCVGNTSQLLVEVIFNSSSTSIISCMVSASSDGFNKYLPARLQHGGACTR